MSNWSDKRINEPLVLDNDPKFDMELTLWRDSEGHGVCALDPKNDHTQLQMVNQRAELRARIQKGHDLQEGFEIFEGQQNGKFTPQRESGLLVSGASVTMDVIEKRAHIMLDLDWEQQQALANQEFGQDPSGR